MPALPIAGAGALSGAAAATVGGLGLGASIALTLGISVVAGGAVTALTGKENRIRGDEGPVGRNVTVRGTNEPRRWIIGSPGFVGGHIVYFNSEGDDGRYLWFVIRWCDHRIESFNKFKIHDIEIDVATEIDGSGFVTKSAFVDDDGNKLLRIKNYDGSQTTVDSQLNTAVTEITSAFVGNDIAYSVFRLEIDESSRDPTSIRDVWEKGEPSDFLADISGKRFFDNRVSNTIFTRNPVIVIRGYMVDSDYGPGYAGSEFDNTFNNAQADIADQDVTVWNGSGGTTTQDRFSLDGVIVMDRDHDEIIDSLLTGCAGDLLLQQDMFKILVAAFRTADWTADESYLAGAADGQAMAGEDERYNLVEGSFYDKDRDGALSDFLPRENSAYLLEDNNETKIRDIELFFTSDNQAAQRIALIHLNKSRLQNVWTAACNLKAFPWGVCDTVEWTLDVFGWVSKPFTIEEVGTAITEGAGIEDTAPPLLITFREADSTDYDYDAPPGPPTPEIDEPGSSPTVTNNPQLPSPPTSLASRSLETGIELTWTNPSMPQVDVIEVHRSDDNDRSNASKVHETRGDVWVDPTELPGGVDYYWVIARGFNGGYSTWEPVGSTAGIRGVMLGVKGGDITDPFFVSVTSGEFWDLDNGIIGGGSPTNATAIVEDDGENNSNALKMWVEFASDSGEAMQVRPVVAALGEKFEFRIVAKTEDTSFNLTIGIRVFATETGQLSTPSTVVNFAAANTYEEFTGTLTVTNSTNLLRDDIIQIQPYVIPGGAGSGESGYVHVSSFNGQLGL